jgi:hypothetical protein
MLRAYALKTTAALGAIGALLWGVVAVQAAGADSTFQSIPPTNPGSGALFGVSLKSSTDIWAVGNRFLNSNTVIATLAEHWNGTSWQVTPTVNPTGNVDLFYGVANISPSNAWAVGYSDTGSGYQALIEHWNGTSWSRVAAPTAPSSSAETLNAVVATSATDVWAVGSHFDSSAGGFVGLTEHFNGASWSIVPSPFLYDAGQGTHVIPDLVTVTATSPTDLWAASSSGVQTAVFEHWNGTTWSVVTGPVNTATNIVAVSSVAASSVSDAWAVGHTRGFGRRAPTLPILEHWNGAAWSVVAPPTGANTELFTVATLASNDAWAAGYSFPTNALVVQHWDGASWSVVGVTTPAGSSINQVLQLSSAAPSTLVGIGRSDNNPLALLSTNA